MPLQRRLARFNRDIGNRLVGRGLSMLPGFAAVVHRGRRSGRLYRTPVKIFRTGDRCLISLPYGPDSDWVKNVLAAGECEVLTGGQGLRADQPRLLADTARAGIPLPFRALLKLMGVADFIEVRAGAAGSTAQPPQPALARGAPSAGDAPE